MHRGDHMILTVSAIVHDDESDLVRRYSKLLSPRILGERIRFAIAMSHCDRFKRFTEIRVKRAPLRLWDVRSRILPRRWNCDYGRIA
jgi:hypothetical protein